mmetsp:Transcript_34020/g.25111  ORF Transcript_34020/g.25111 Transcript_34020/m.25111 type:complete len:144 (+) Transcript_34020:745-1176(+)
MIQAHQIELERRRQDYNDKIEADSERYKLLKAEKEEEAKRFEKKFQDMISEHNEYIEQLEREQKVELENQIKDTNRLKEQIEEMMKKHKEMRDNIENEAWDKIDQIKERNKEELAKIIDAGMESKANLTLVTNDFKERRSQRD